METTKVPEEPQSILIREDHPWLEVQDENLDEEIRFSLDEIRIF